MKKLLLGALAVLFLWLMFNHTLNAQERNPWQVGIFGGASATLGHYHGDTAQADLGYVGGVFADHYFGGNFGVGLDARFIQHPLWGGDSVFFQNGYLATTYHAPKRFRHTAMGIGPTYRFQTGRFDLELFAKGGVLFQQFPDYTRELVYEVRDAMGGIAMQSLAVRQTANTSSRALAWMGVGGLRFNYGLAQQWSIFVQADYLTVFSAKFGGSASEFFIQERIPIQPITEGMYISDPFTFFEDKPVVRTTFTQAASVTVGLKYTFRRPRGAKPLAPAPKMIVEAAPPVNPAEPVSKEVLIVVKDKQTGLALSGVKVMVVGSGVEHITTTNSNGEAGHLTDVQPGTYRITGDKNGIAATAVSVTPSDFQRGGNVIYKELLHDDPRFTLVGQTVECDSDVQLAGINTTLTNETSNANMSQVSDAEGKFIYQLDQQRSYLVVANQAGKYSQTERISTVGLDRSQTLYVTLKLGVCALETGTSWVVKNILYNFDKSEIRSDAAQVLDNVVNILQQNPTLRIELSSHTDSRGNDTYNLRLSQQRADAAVQYLVSQGVARDRMVARGYGETKLVNACADGVGCDEADHEQNRRTEIKVLSY